MVENKEVKVEQLTELDPGKVYVVEVVKNLSDEEEEAIVSWAKNLRLRYKIDVVFMPRGSMKFINAPRGYKIVQEEKEISKVTKKAKDE